MSQADDSFNPSRRGFLRMAPAAVVGVGLGVNVGKSLDEEIGEAIDHLKDLWVRRHGELKTAVMDHDHKFILITSKLDA